MTLMARYGRLTAAAALTCTALSIAVSHSAESQNGSATQDAIAAASGAIADESSTLGETSKNAKKKRRNFRIREGTKLWDLVGQFKQTGDSLTFVDAEQREFGGLPNLNLERVSRMLKTVDELESITWSISGTVTEFSGKNYLLISRAVYKAAAPPPVPEALENQQR